MTVETDAGMTFTLQASMPGTRKITRTANLTAGGIAKFGADGVLEKASKSSDVGEDADYRDPKDAKCYEAKFTEWIGIAEDGYPIEIRWTHPGEFETEGWVPRGPTVDSPRGDANSTSIKWEAVEWSGGGTQGALSATRQRTATKDETFVTTSFVTNRFNKVRAALDSFAGSTVSDLVNALKNALKE